MLIEETLCPHTPLRPEGLCFGPLVHQYYAFSDHILPVEGGLMNRVQKIFMDQTIYLTVKCSIYIFAVGLLSGDDWETCKQNVKNKIGGIVVTAWKFWPLIHCITYGVIPARHRILWVNSVDLIWNAILATQAQQEQPEDTPVEDIEKDHAAGATFFAEENMPVSEQVVAVTQTANEFRLNGDCTTSSPIVSDAELKVPKTDDAGPVMAIAGEKESEATTPVLAEPDDKVVS